MPHTDFIQKVNAFCWKELSDHELKKQIRPAVSNLPKLYSLLKEIIFRCTGLTLFDTQISAAYAIQLGHIAELPTGEGKTLAAVVTAICFALQGKSVHVLVFNDYLAKRDCLSNLPVIQFCGLEAGYIEESTKPSQRKKAYACDIVYVSAKEAGFDFLRDFLQERTCDIVFPGCNAAIIDEADSILIDEARIPLVLAGEAKRLQEDLIPVSKAISTLCAEDVVINKNDHKVWLTDEGIDHMERLLHITLYDDQHQKALAMTNFALEAQFLLEKDKDYLVKGETLQVIDEATGRVVENRKFPDLLHYAVQIKEGLCLDSQTMIFNTISMQSFLLLYKTLCGMTGTIATSAMEVQNLYDLTVDVIPPHTPCIRKDHPDEIFKTDKDQQTSVLQTIQQAHRKGQPVLLGTQSVFESEQYALLLADLGIPHHVLNARNNEMEAEIIAQAGTPYAVTVSTNMAGRGVDIKLGGKTETEKDFVRNASGLYVISTGINRSLRIDNQLKGRAGRQGDPGESKFFISMERTFTQYFSYKPFHEVLVDNNPMVQKRLYKIIREIQKEEERKDAEAHYMLERYATIQEQQRQWITSHRTDILFGKKRLSVLQTQEPQFYQKVLSEAGISGIETAERQLLLYFINQHWADYLSTMEYVREGIHLMVIGGKSPLDEYHKAAISAFAEMNDDIERDVVSSMKKYKITPDGIDMAAAGMSGASSTWTYMIDESQTQFSRIPQMVHTVSSRIKGSVFTFRQLYYKLKSVLSCIIG